MARHILDRPRPHPRHVIVPGELLPVPVLGGETASKVHVRELSHRCAGATPYVREQLRLTDDQVTVTEQVTSLDGVPLYLTVGYSAPRSGFDRFSRTVSELDTVEEIPEVATSFRILFGVEYGGYRSVIEAVHCDERTAQLLHLPEGSVTLMREMVLFDRDTRPHHICWTHYRPDLTAMVSSVRRPLGGPWGGQDDG